MIGVIGCGNMASAIVEGIHANFSDLKFMTYTPSFTRADDLARKVSGKAVKTLKELDSCEILIIACKPQQFEDLATDLKKEVNLKGKLIVSIMAAISSSHIAKALGTDLICRVMPNTPSLVGEGVSLLYYTDQVPEKERAQMASYFKACSQTHILESEELFDKVTAVTGSGPAYVFYFAKTMVDSLKSWGVNESQARSMVTQLFKGSVALMEVKENIELGELIDQVTSKKGVTIEAINHFKEAGLDEMTSKALKKAVKRSEEIKSELALVRRT